MLKARDFIPALKMGAKMGPQDIAGMIGLPFIGNVFYVDPTDGVDGTATGTDEAPYKTLAAAYARTQDSNHDVIIIIPSAVGAGSGTVETAAITWSKSLTHLIGNCAPVYESSRARVTTATASLSPFITISGSGCIFKNVQFNNTGSGLINVRVSGNRNYFENVHFMFPAHATPIASANSAALELYGCQENNFVSCTVGTDTATRSAANTNLKITLGADTVARNIFDGCIFPTMTSSATSLFIKQADSVGMDRFNMFRGCAFINATSSTSTTMTDAVAIHATPGGMLVFQNCLKIGATGWGDNLTNLYLLGESSNATYNQGIGFAVNPAA